MSPTGDLHVTWFFFRGWLCLGLPRSSVLLHWHSTLPEAANPWSIIKLNTGWVLKWHQKLEISFHWNVEYKRKHCYKYKSLRKLYLLMSMMTVLVQDHCYSDFLSKQFSIQPLTTAVWIWQNCWWETRYRNWWLPTGCSTEQLNRSTRFCWKRPCMHSVCDSFSAMQQQSTVGLGKGVMRKIVQKKLTAP